MKLIGRAVAGGDARGTIEVMLGTIHRIDAETLVCETCGVSAPALELAVMSSCPGPLHPVRVARLEHRAMLRGVAEIERRSAKK